MKSKLQLSVLLGLLALLLSTVVVMAQGPTGGKQPSPRAPHALPGTGFAYQGQLKKSGALVNDTCDFQFSLWDGSGLATQVGTTDAVSAVSVSNGQFNVVVNFTGVFGATAFNGDARWLQIAVRCPAGGGAYTPFASRQPLTPVPLAFALPGLFTQQNATSSNIIGGYNGNSVTDGVFGATIGGGGASGMTNRVTDHYGTVGGGRNNQAGDGTGTVADRLHATVGGGYGNTASGLLATIGGGNLNTASGAGSFVGGGGHDGVTPSGNTASGNIATIGGGLGNSVTGYSSIIGGGNGNSVDAGHGTIGGGITNTITSGANGSTIAGGYLNNIDAGGVDATIGGGYGNSADGYLSTISGGHGNIANGTNTTIGGGYGNTASGVYATVSGGISNTTSGAYAAVPGGLQANASHYGEMAYANGAFSAAGGDAQTSVYVLRNITASATQTELFLDSVAASQRITIASGRTVTFDILVTGRTTALSAGYHVLGVIENVVGTTTLISAIDKTVLGEDAPAWDVDIQADDTNDALVIKVTGAAATTIRWVASVRTVEVNW